MMEGDRREFLKTGGLALAGAALAGVASAQPSRTPGPHGAVHNGMSAAAHTNLMQALFPGAVGPDGQYVLPPLPYPADALEPHIDVQTMTLHHDAHHKSYVDNLNKANQKILEIGQGSGDAELLPHYLHEASFNGGGHFLHCVFWNCMSPDGGGEPQGALAERIQKDLGGNESAMKLFKTAASKVQGSGWGILGYQIAGDKLVVLQSEKHNVLSQWGIIPLLVVDVWEHAYYLKYQNKRAAYLDAFTNVIDWNSVGRRFEILLGQSGPGGHGSEEAPSSTPTSGINERVTRQMNERSGMATPRP